MKKNELSENQQGFVEDVSGQKTNEGSAVDLEVVVNESQITSIRFINMEESVPTLYPLMEPALDDLAQQIYESQDLSTVKYNNENRYTSLMLLEAISNTLEKASLNLVPETE